MDGLFSDFSKAGVLGKIRNVPMHFSVHFHVLHHLVLVGFETAVHIVQFQAGYLASSGIVQLRRQVFSEGVVDSVLFPARYDVPTIFHDHPVHFRNLLRRILQVGIHGHDNSALGNRETLVKSGRLAIIAPERYSFDSAVAFRQFLNLCP